MPEKQNNADREMKTTPAQDRRHKILTIIGAVLCVILIPMLIVNCTLIIKSYTNQDETPSIGGVVPMFVESPSMHPLIQTGDMIFAKVVDPEEIEIGDVISFYDPDNDYETILTHRVYDIQEKDDVLYFYTQGDANDSPDRKPVAAQYLIGKYTGVRLAHVGSIGTFMQTTTGLILCVVVPILLFVGYDLVRRRLYEKGNAEDVEALKAELAALRAAQAEKNANLEEAPAEEKPADK